ncbi:hypothetical protein F441_20970 [Phytophthora nicotianae CJ01A1]|uniref:Uncharacterized protein n=4 Tax=Phytophthora nicotianae TaxID=4792 RepID=W2PJ21_PHYN3|nr:hypothetical protein PPTG_24342 [Phytophthora nicotianae INRA-310]ETI29848.1 hypothetical protein F443_23035 [Phytophthora nicotianae P1569]ETN00025.1 hypothetical protein PPTG_24342 [Phytophthora nicotianae INRA-310]ETO60743.1 hypothetical protein F444_21115 [Phytophthora nicotianae P1976]ETP01862.1 hypothetical protein F441_20970 [Phytophthora nicotianae CJ01A1]
MAIVVAEYMVTIAMVANETTQALQVDMLISSHFPSVLSTTRPGYNRHYFEEHVHLDTTY